MEWVDNHIEITPKKRNKKLTGTRFASIFGLNPWATEFEIWCAITKTYEKPFEDTIYTIAGKTCEPKIIEYLRTSYAMDNIVTPTDIYGENYFQKTWGDFFKDNPILGGSWDSLLYEDGRPSAVIEIKTTKRSEDWREDVPEYYALQAALYAHLLDVDDVIMVASFLAEADYECPEFFIPSTSNTITVEFKVSERYPDFANKVEYAEEWWKEHVLTGVSPDYDEKKDAEILKALRTRNIAPDTDIQDLLKEAEALKAKIDAILESVKTEKKRLDELSDMIKDYSIAQFKNGDKKVEVKGQRFTWSISRSESTTIDKSALEADGLLDRYSKPSTIYRMSVK